MYNGIAAIDVKGTGLSGYVQRSRAAVLQLSKFTPAEYTDDAPSVSINPLEALRSVKENRELAARLQRHKMLRSIRLKVLLYREERLAKGVPSDVVDRECHTLRESLLRNHRDEVGKAKQAEKMETAQKSAERFAAAFHVKHGVLGDAFDRTKREEEKREAEEARRRVMEKQIAERVKRVKGE